MRAGVSSTAHSLAAASRLPYGPPEQVRARTFDVRPREYITPIGVLLGMTLAEQLDSLLFGWLEQRADTGPPRRADARGTAVVAVTERLVPDVEAFCARWNLGVRVRPADTGHWAVLRVDGPSLPVEGLAAVIELYRRGGS